MAFVKKRRIDAKYIKEYFNQLNDPFFSEYFNTSDRNTSKISSLSGHNFTKIRNQTNQQLKDDKLLCDPKWMEKFLSGEVETHYYSSEKSNNVVDFVSSRAIDNRGLRGAKLSEMFAIRHLLANNLLREQLFECTSFNKVFSSQWLDDRQVVFGTKCNKLIVVNVLNKKQIIIPTLKSSSKGIEPDNVCGIHAIQINPSGTLLATGGDNPNDVAIYRLPTFDPICVGEGAHSDWIFDMKWLDDQFLVSGSRDTSLALWRFDDNSNSLKAVSTSSAPEYFHTKPVLKKVCNEAEKIRALLYNGKNEEVVVLSLNAKIHLFDCQSLAQTMTKDLPFCMENVCLSQDMDRNLYAVGSKSHVSLLDGKSLNPINKILSKNQGCGIRSLSFDNDLLTIGTGAGTVLFYDIRAMKYLLNLKENKYSFLKASKGYVYPEEMFSDIYFHIEYSPAIYTHQYDSSKTRLFTAGGPLPASLQGSYVGLWS